MLSLSLLVGEPVDLVHEAGPCTLLGCLLGYLLLVHGAELGLLTLLKHRGRPRLTHG